MVRSSEDLQGLVGVNGGINSRLVCRQLLIQFLFYFHFCSVLWNNQSTKRTWFVFVLDLIIICYHFVFAICLSLLVVLLFIRLDLWLVMLMVYFACLLLLFSMLVASEFFLGFCNCLSYFTTAKISFSVSLYPQFTHMIFVIYTLHVGCCCCYCCFPFSPLISTIIPMFLYYEYILWHFKTVHTSWNISYPIVFNIVIVFFLMYAHYLFIVSVSFFIEICGSYVLEDISLFIATLQILIEKAYVYVYVLWAFFGLSWCWFVGVWRVAGCLYEGRVKSK